MATLKEDPNRLNLGSRIRFVCRPGVKCFNTCCRDVNIFLTPNDVYRLKQRLNMTSTEFLEKYTLMFISKATGLPVVLLKMRDDNKECHFLTPKGCSVYSDRPWSCRMYPFSLNPEDETYSIIADQETCLGFKEDQEWYLEDWLADQGVLYQREIDRLFNDALGRLEFPKDKILNSQISRMVYMAAYDLDTFRRFVFESRFLKIFNIAPPIIEKVKTDDEELARLAFLWLKFGMSDKNALEIRPEVLQQQGDLVQDQK